MAWFRISKVNILDESKIAPILDEIRESVSAISSDFIEMARAEDNARRNVRTKRLQVSKCSDQEIKVVEMLAYLK